MAGRRQPFTPQRSPSQPASEASPTLSEEQNGQAFDRPDSHTFEGIASSSTAAISSLPSVSALRGWTAHQSHGQATVLFYVPRWIREADLDIQIGERFVIAGIRGQPPTVKAGLAGRVDHRSSSWQLEKRTAKRRRDRSRSRTRTSSAGHSSGSQSSGGGRVDGEVATTTASRGPTKRRDGGHPRQRQGTQSPSHSDASGFDFLSRSTDTFGSGPSSSRHRQASHDEVQSSPALSSPASMSQSMTLSESGTGEYVPSVGHGSRSTSSGDVQSLGSSVNFGADPHHGYAIDDDDDDPIRDAKLVTLHLDKIDGGIWPCIVVGPAPAQHEMDDEDGAQQKIARLIQTSSRSSLDAALREALSQKMQPARSRTFSLESEESGDEVARPRLNESTTTIDTIGSDDDTTVLGVSISRKDEERFNMDPVSMTLIGLQHARSGGGGPAGSLNMRDEMFGFECLRRAWKEAEIPAAITWLVDEFLPLLPSSLHALAPYRQRLTAALGGASALARLYVSYAHLHMPAYDHEKPLLSLPLSGTSNNPFGASQSRRPQNTSPRLSAGVLAVGLGQLDVAEDAVLPGPLQFLEEAQRIDPTIDITQADWLQARTIEQAYPVSESWSRAISVTSRSEGRVESDASGSRHDHRHGRRKGHGHGHEKKRRSSKRDRFNAAAKTDDSLVFLVVSRAALLSVVVAGGVAVAGWWRRASASAG